MGVLQNIRAHPLLLSICLSFSSGINQLRTFGDRLCGMVGSFQWAAGISG